MGGWSAGRLTGIHVRNHCGDNGGAYTRVEANYDACFNLALAVLNAEGWKARAVPGHHEFTLEAACSAVGGSRAGMPVERARW
jgi:hypothetical protein